MVAKVPKKTAKPIKIKLHRHYREQLELVLKAHQEIVEEEEEEEEEEKEKETLQRRSR